MDRQKDSTRVRVRRFDDGEEEVVALDQVRWGLALPDSIFLRLEQTRCASDAEDHHQPYVRVDEALDLDDEPAWAVRVTVLGEEAVLDAGPDDFLAEVVSIEPLRNRKHPTSGTILRPALVPGTDQDVEAVRGLLRYFAEPGMAGGGRELAPFASRVSASLSKDGAA